jgi:O-acetyl-ADP-ribose deacetylase (regulator of RNase III)
MFPRKSDFCIFFATPTTGSPYAKLASLVSHNPQFKQLFPMQPDGYLAPLQSDWLAAGLRLRSYCGFETEPFLGQIIVERQSATNLCNERLDPIDANHLTIVKPTDVNATPYRALKAAFSETSPPPSVRHEGNAPRTTKPVVETYQPGKRLSVLLASGRRIIVMLGELDETKADVIARFTDERGNNRDGISEAAIRRLAGPSFNSEIQVGLESLHGTLVPGTAFGVPTKSDIPGQIVCNTFGPTYQLEPALAPLRLAGAYDTCFQLGATGPALSIAFPAYSGTDFPDDIAARVVIERLTQDLAQPTRVVQALIVARQESFPPYSKALATKLGLELNRKSHPASPRGRTN